MDNLLITLAAFLVLGTGTAVASFGSAPLVTEALSGAGLGGFAGVADQTGRYLRRIPPA